MTGATRTAKQTRKQKKTTRLISNNNKNNNNFARAAHFFFAFLCRCLDDYSVKLSSYTFLGGNVSCSHKKFCFLCSCSLSFSLPLIFTILAAKIYHFHFQIWPFFCFISCCSPFSVKTRLCCCCCFSFSKSSGGQDDHNIDVYHHVKHRLQPRHRKTDHFTLVTVWCGRKDGCMDGRKGVRSRDNQNFSHAWITKFSYPGYSTGELRYTSFNYHPDFLEVKDK